MDLEAEAVRQSVLMHELRPWAKSIICPFQYVVVLELDSTTLWECEVLKNFFSGTSFDELYSTMGRPTVSRERR